MAILEAKTTTISENWLLFLSKYGTFCGVSIYIDVIFDQVTNFLVYYVAELPLIPFFLQNHVINFPVKNTTKISNIHSVAEFENIHDIGLNLLLY